MGQVRDVAQLGAPVIREVAQPVAAIDDSATQSLIDDMLATVAAEGGMGIAAPQVYASLRIIVICSRPNERYPHAPHMTPTVLINPQVVNQSQTMDIDWEGCLTIPGLRGQVPRHRWVEVQYIDRDGHYRQATYDHFVARVFQHEVDHLDGIVYLDRMSSTKDVVMEKEWRRMMAEGKDGHCAS